MGEGRGGGFSAGNNVPGEAVKCRTRQNEAPHFVNSVTLLKHSVISFRKLVIHDVPVRVVRS